MSGSRKIRVSILGGGLAGVTLLRGLLLQSHLDVNIYESRPQFREEGAGIVIQHNAQLALNLISPKLMEDLWAAGAVQSVRRGRRFIGCGPDAGKEVPFEDADRGEKYHANLSIMVGRHAFLQQMLDGVDQRHLHASKKLSFIETLPESDEYILHFEDGSSEVTDVIIGADGVHGRVRSHVLGEHPSVAPRYPGWWHMACFVPAEAAKQVLGSDLDLVNPTQRMYGGESGQTILYDFAHSKKAVQTIITVRGDRFHDPKDTSSEISLEEILKEYAHWPKKFGQDYVHLLYDNTPKPARCWPQTEHLSAPTYVKGAICIMGDAAHCMTPWQASGGGMAIEDAFILCGLLESSKVKSDVVAAFKAYDVVRRPRTQRVVESSRRTGEILSGLDPDVGLDIEKMRKAQGPRWDFILNFDVQGHRDEAVRLMKQNLKP